MITAGDQIPAYEPDKDDDEEREPPMSFRERQELLYRELEAQGL